MGGGTYTHEAYERIRVTRDYANKSREEIFQSRKLDPEMDPRNIQLRESRDSDEHPESVSIIVALDVTGSMGFVPEDLVKNTLPDLMGTLMKAGIEHPQILFLGIGDHVYDNAPLQVGQFESSAELLDRWLTKVYLEQGGGGNSGESYHLAWLFAARHTAIDCWEKRNKKGFIFTIGDEPCFETIPADTIKRLTPADEASTVTAAEILVEAQERYNAFHLHIMHNARAELPERQANWQELLGERFMLIQDYKSIAERIATIVIDHYQPESVSSSVSTNIEVEEML